MGHFERLCQHTRWDKEGVSLLQLHPLAPVGPVSQEDVALLARQHPVLVQGEVVRRWRHQPEHLRERREYCWKQTKKKKDNFPFTFKYFNFQLLLSGWSYFAALEQVIPNWCPAKINVEVCVASLYAHETIPGVEKQHQKASLSARKWPMMVADISLRHSTNDQPEHCAEENCLQWDISPLEINRRAISAPRHRRFSNWARWEGLNLSESIQSMRCTQIH